MQFSAYIRVQKAPAILRVSAVWSGLSLCIQIVPGIRAARISSRATRTMAAFV